MELSDLVRLSSASEFSKIAQMLACAKIAGLRKRAAFKEKHHSPLRTTAKFQIMPETQNIRQTKISA